MRGMSWAVRAVRRSPAIGGRTPVGSTVRCVLLTCFAARALLWWLRGSRPLPVVCTPVQADSLLLGDEGGVLSTWVGPGREV